MSRNGRWGAAIVWIVGAVAAVASTLAPAGAQAVPGDPWLVTDPRFVPLDANALGVEGVGEFRGAIRLSRSGNGLAVVNHVGLDDYLRGISEVPTSWPLEAQKAQAIAARTYALWEVGRTNVNAPYKQVGADICATDACQVYTGVAKERRPGSEAWTAAVDQTSAQVITFRNAPIVAKYSSSNGGQTVAGGEPYLRAMADPDDARSPLHRWRAAYPVGEVVRAVGLAAEPAHLTRQGDEVVATYVDPDGNPVEQRVPVGDFRRSLNNALPRPEGLPLPVPSIRYDIATGEGIVVLDGRGWGHGIGMSQYGALGKALRGMKAPDIIAAYYAGLRPVAVPAERLPAEVRVAVALDRGEATVTDSDGRFRIVDGDGRVIAAAATGRWSALPGPRGAVRLVPPVDQAGPPAASLAALEPPAPRPGDAVVLRLELRGPAATTRITFTGPDGATRELDPPTLRASGPLAVRLGAGATATPGTYRIDLEQDAGAGRAATTSIPLEVSVAPAPPQPAPAGQATAAVGGVSPGPPAHGAPPAPASPLAVQALAATLLLAVAAAGAAIGRMGRAAPAELH